MRQNSKWKGWVHCCAIDNIPSPKGRVYYLWLRQLAQYYARKSTHWPYRSIKHQRVWDIERCDERCNVISVISSCKLIHAQGTILCSALLWLSSIPQTEEESVITWIKTIVVSAIITASSIWRTLACWILIWENSHFKCVHGTHFLHHHLHPQQRDTMKTLGSSINHRVAMLAMDQHD